MAPAVHETMNFMILYHSISREQEGRLAKQGKQEQLWDHIHRKEKKKYAEPVIEEQYAILGLLQQQNIFSYYGY